jgi:two-component system chemotaxis response regulator CheY
MENRAKKPRILIVDDNHQHRNLLSLLFVAQGYAPVEACDGLQGLEKMSEGEAFDAVISDVEMPGMDGISFVSEIRRRSLTVPVIVNSCNGGYQRSALGAGANHFVLKPCRIAQYVSLLEKCQGSAQASCR